MSNVKGKVNDKIDEAAHATKRTANKVMDKSKDLAKETGKAMEKGGKRLRHI